VRTRRQAGRRAGKQEAAGSRQQQQDLASQSHRHTHTHTHRHRHTLRQHAQAARTHAHTQVTRAQLEAWCDKPFFNGRREGASCLSVVDFTVCRTHLMAY
jgi:hypothetical protein